MTLDCTDDRFGLNCELRCSDVTSNQGCRDTEVCSNDSCTCMPGYNGDNCYNGKAIFSKHKTVSYKLTKNYLPVCSNQYDIDCQSQCGHCRNDARCNTLNGSCPNYDCVDGFMPGILGLCNTGKNTYTDRKFNKKEYCIILLAGLQMGNNCISIRGPYSRRAVGKCAARKVSHPGKCYYLHVQV
jgi:hypothetical protein